MKRPFIIGAIISVVTWASPLRAADAPFGLRWGAIPEELGVLGIKLSPIKPDDSGERYIATNLPKVIHDLEVVVLSFGQGKKLHRIASISKTFERDPYGAAVKQRYDELREILSEKYGQCKSHHSIDSEVWRKSSEFVMGLYQGRSSYYTNCTKEGVDVQLGIRGKGLDDSYLVLIFEDKNLGDATKGEARRREKDAL